MKKIRTTTLAAIAAAIALVGISSNASFALRQLTEAERAAVIAEYLAEKEAKAAAKPAEAAPAESKEAAPAAVVKVEVVQAEAKNDAPVVKVEQPAEAKVEAEKAEIKAEAAAPASADVKPEPILTVTGGTPYGSGPRHEGADDIPSLYGDVPFFNKTASLRVDGKVETVTDGSKAFVIFPNREAQTVKVADLGVKDVLVPTVKEGKATWKRLPSLLTWPKDKPYSFENYSTLTDFLVMRRYGLIVTEVGVGNIAEAVRGHRLDKPVKTIAVLEDPALTSDGRIIGNRVLYVVGQSKPAHVIREADFDGLVYWVRVRAPRAVAQKIAGTMHHRSAKWRAADYVACDSLPGEEPQAYFSLMFGVEGAEHKRPGQEGLERSIPARELVQLDQTEMLEAAKAAVSK